MVELASAGSESWERHMFHIGIAGVVVGIDERYNYIQNLCREYTVTGEEPAFIVRVERWELKQALAELPLLERLNSRGYYESLCLYRKISLGMVDYDAFLMHSAVIEVEGHALAFAAKSGVGKSTHIRLWRERYGRGVHIINGDKPIFRFIDGQLYACGTPWKGKEGWGRNVMAPLKTLCFLEQGSENRLERLSPAEVMPRLFHQLLLPKEPERMDRFLVLVDRMLETTPCYLLHCDATLAAAETARSGLLGGDVI